LALLRSQLLLPKGKLTTVTQNKSQIALDAEQRRLSLKESENIIYKLV
jgi:hypothetical protein